MSKSSDNHSYKRGVYFSQLPKFNQSRLCYTTSPFYLFLRFSDYKEKIQLKCQFLIEPKAKEPMKHQYDYGETSEALPTLTVITSTKEVMFLLQTVWLLVKFIKHNQNYYLKLDVLTSVVNRNLPQPIT